MSKILEVNDLKMYFPYKKNFIGQTTQTLKAVDGVSLYIDEGEILGLVGESGCGKTTTGRSIVRLLNPTDGNIIFLGDDITHKNKKELQSIYKNIQLIFQDPYASLNPRKKVGKAIMEVLKVHGENDKNKQIEKTKELFSLVGLNDQAMEKYPHEFSGGQRQRVIIARALAVSPKLIICDEPVSALDVSIQAQIINLLIELRDKLGLSYLFISHDLRVIQYISDRVSVMYLGKIVEEATTEALFSNPLHPYTMALLSSVNGQHKEQPLLPGEVPSPVNPPSGCSFRTRCPFAMDICAQETPELLNQNKNHKVACHLYTKENNE
jgi:oligopeptide transport system ATP-binding protein